MNTKKVIIQNIASGEVHTFDSMKEAAAFVGVNSSESIAKLSKGLPMKGFKALLEEVKPLLNNEAEGKALLEEVKPLLNNEAEGKALLEESKTIIDEGKTIIDEDKALVSNEEIAVKTIIEDSKPAKPAIVCPYYSDENGYDLEGVVKCEKRISGKCAYIIRSWHCQKQYEDTLLRAADQHRVRVRQVKKH